MRICLFDGPNRSDLLPLVYTRPVADLNIGASKLSDRWVSCLNAVVVVETIAYLQAETPPFDVAIQAGCLPNPELIAAINNLNNGQKLMHGANMIAFKGAVSSTAPALNNFEAIAFDADITIIRYPWDLFSNNAKTIHADAASFVASHNNKLHESNQHHGEHALLIGDGVTAFAAIFNTAEGPIIIDDGATIMEGAMLRGPLYIGKNTVVKMGSKIYGGTTIGHNCKVGGELNNVIFHANSNKGHDGFLGNAVIGEWCNLGAATDASNLKNDYSETRAWNYTQQKFISTGLQFCGPIIGDHSKTAIQTPLNTATVIGVGCNIFTVGFPRTFIPSFSRGGAQGVSENNPSKVLETARVVMARRGYELSKHQENVLREIFTLSQQFRKKSS